MSQYTSQQQSQHQSQQQSQQQSQSLYFSFPNIPNTISTESLFKSQESNSQHTIRNSQLSDTFIFETSESFLVCSHVYSDYVHGRVCLSFKGCYDNEAIARIKALDLAKQDLDEPSILKKCEGGIKGPLCLEDSIVSYFSMKLANGQVSFTNRIDFNPLLDQMQFQENTRFYSVIRLMHLSED